MNLNFKICFSKFNRTKLKNRSCCNNFKSKKKKKMISKDCAKIYNITNTSQKTSIIKLLKFWNKSMKNRMKKVNPKMYKIHHGYKFN